MANPKKPGRGGRRPASSAATEAPAPAPAPVTTVADDDDIFGEKPAPTPVAVTTASKPGLRAGGGPPAHMNALAQAVAARKASAGIFGDASDDEDEFVKKPAPVQSRSDVRVVISKLERLFVIRANFIVGATFLYSSYCPV